MSELAISMVEHISHEIKRLETKIEVALRRLQSPIIAANFFKDFKIIGEIDIKYVAASSGVYKQTCRQAMKLIIEGWI